MARKRNYRRNNTRVYRNTRVYNSRRRSFRRGGRRGGIGMMYFAGAAAAFVPVNIPPMVKTAALIAAVAPVKLPFGLKGLCQGYVLGETVKGLIGNPLAPAAAAPVAADGGEVI